jgi:hypothetical protein
MLYNCKSFIYLFINVLNYYNYSLLEFAAYYRKQNPGFAHDGFLKKPSVGLLKSIHQEFNNIKSIEDLYKMKYNMFKNEFCDKYLKKYIKWDNGNYLLTPYNTFYVDSGRYNEFINYMKVCNICVVSNPTYKIFNHDYIGKDKDKKFNDALVYMPSLANMSLQEMRFLAHKINLFEELVD